MITSFLPRTIVFAMVLASCAHAAFAGENVYRFSGDTTDGSAYGDDKKYVSFNFSVSDSGRYRFYTAAGYDNAIALSNYPFSVSSTADVLTYVDDTDAVGEENFSYDLVAGSKYTFVNFSGRYSGDFQSEITGPGTVIALAAVPEPETYAMLLAGLGLMGALARRPRADKKSSTC